MNRDYGNTRNVKELPCWQQRNRIELFLASFGIQTIAKRVDEKKNEQVFRVSPLCDLRMH